MQSLKAFQPCAAPPRRAVARSPLQIHCRISRVGKTPIAIPKGVTVTLDAPSRVLSVKGPLGALQQELSPFVKIEQDATKVQVQAADESKEAMKMHGLHRTLVNNMVVGVSTGFTKKLDLMGTGYRAAVAGKELTLNVGYNKPRVLAIPEGLKVAIEKQVALSVSGYDKVAVGDFCATVRRQRPPEPYKGKGIRYNGEVIKLKEGKGAGGKKK